MLLLVVVVVAELSTMTLGVEVVQVLVTFVGKRKMMHWRRRGRLMTLQ